MLFIDAIRLKEEGEKKNILVSIVECDNHYLVIIKGEKFFNYWAAQTKLWENDSDA